MTGVTLKIEAELAAKALANLTPDQMEAMVYGIGQLVEDQTKVRIADEKAGPDGEAWAPWSKRYAASLAKANRVTARSLLLGDPNLLPSIQNYTKGLEAVVGSNMVYAAIHQFGGRGIPARPYLGLSGENRKDIEALVIDTLKGLLQ
jgi:phage virion morphogenesis protein